MYKDIHKYIPFEHDNIDFKNNIINTARNQDKTKVEGSFTAVLVYTNVVDYLAKHLLQNLSKMVSIYSFNKFGGTFFYDGSSKSYNLPLGNLIRELNYFDFPNKKDFLERLSDFNKLRIGVIHNLMQLEPNDPTNNLDASVLQIGNIAEDLLKKYTSIVNGLTIAWNNANS